MTIVCDKMKVHVGESSMFHYVSGWAKFCTHEQIYDTIVVFYQRWFWKGLPEQIVNFFHVYFLLKGSDTILNALLWMFLYLAIYPEVQRKVQEELDDVIGRDKLPTLQDEQNLPYLCKYDYDITLQTNIQYL